MMNQDTIIVIDGEQRDFIILIDGEPGDTVVYTQFEPLHSDDITLFDSQGIDLIMTWQLIFWNSLLLISK